MALLQCIGTGKAVLAAEYNTLRDQIAGRLTRLTYRTITDMTGLDADVAKPKSEALPMIPVNSVTGS